MAFRSCPARYANDLFFSGFILLSIAACAVYFGPFGPSGQPDPTIIQTAPRPDYFFLWLYAVLSLLPPSLETPALLIGPVIALAVLLALPFFSGEGEKSWKRRPIAVLAILAGGGRARDVDTSGRLRAVESGDGRLERRTDSSAIPERAYGPGAARSASFSSRSSATTATRWVAWEDSAGRHSIESPSSSPQDQLIRQVIQGGGNMPAYGKNLSPPETTALVAFLETLHPAGQPPARDASRAVESGVRPCSQWHPTGESAVTVTLDCGGAGLRAGLVSVSEFSSKCVAGVAAGGVHGRTVCTVVRRWGLLSPLWTINYSQLHMVQHLLLMTVAAPLILLGAPVIAFLYGLPQRFVPGFLTPLLSRPAVHEAGRIVTHPVFCWLASTATVIGWHVPALFALGMRSEGWHAIEHACFLAAGLLFWWPVVQPWPSLARLAPVGHSPVPFSCHAALRCAFGFSYIL